MVCTKWFFAKDQDGDALPFAVDFTLMKRVGSQWVIIDTYTIPRGGYYQKTGLIDHPQRYEARPHIDVEYEDDWELPKDEEFTCRGPDITFVYERVCPKPYCSSISASDDTPDSGEQIQLWAEWGGGDGHYITSHVWDFGDETTSTVSSPYKTWNNTTGSAVTYTVELVVTNDCGKSKTRTKDITVAPAVTTATVTVIAVLRGTADDETAPDIVDAAIWQVYYGQIPEMEDTGYTTPHTFELDPGTYYFFTKKEHYIHIVVESVTLVAGDSKTLPCGLFPAGLQCDIELLTSGEGVVIPEVFPPPIPDIPLPPPPTFGFKFPCIIGDFSYYGLDWAVLNEPLPDIVVGALVGSIEVQVNDTVVDIGITGSSLTGDIAFDLLAVINALLADGIISADTTELVIKITYATRIWFKTGEHTTNEVLETDTITLPAIPIVTPGPIICLPDLDLVELPTIPLTFPAPGAPGLPTLDPSVTSLPIDMTLAVPPCLQNSTEVGDPSGLFPVPVEVYLIDMVTPVTTHNVLSEGDFTIDIITFIRAVLAKVPPWITPDTNEIDLKIRYPSRLKFPAPPDEEVPYAEITDTIAIVGPTLCDLSVYASDPGIIPIDITFPPSVGSVPITAAFSAVCDNGAPADLLKGITANVYINDVYFGQITTPDDTGIADFDLSTNTNWLSSISLGDTTMELKITFPEQIQGSTPIGSKDYTKPLRIEVTGPPAVICLPSIPSDDVTYPPSIELGTPLIVGGLPTLSPVSDPVTFEASMSCSQDGAYVTPIFPFYAEFFIEEYKVGDIPVYSGTNMISIADLTAYIYDAITAGRITLAMDSFQIKLVYPTRIEDGVPGSYTTIVKTIDITAPKVPVPVICLPSIPADTVTHPPNIQLSPPLIEGGLPTLDPVSDPVTFRAYMSCSQDGASVTPVFPFYAEFFIEEYKVGDIPVYSGINTIPIATLTAYIYDAITAGRITLAMSSFKIILKYPTRIEDGVPGEYTMIVKTIDITPPVVPGPVICLPSIPVDTVTHPPNIQLSPPLIEGGLPTLDPVSDPVTFRAYMSCSQDGASVTPIFPFYAEFFIEEYKVGDIPVYSGINTIPIATLTAAINEAIAAGTITLAMSSFKIILKYPTRIEDGVPGEYTTISKTIDITPPGVPPAPIVCNITNVTDNESLIVTISELGILTVDPCDVDVQLYTDDCGKSMAEILAVTGGYLSLNHADGTPFASIPLDIYGEGVLDIASYARNWMLTLTDIPTSLDLVLVCPTKVTFSVPPVAEYEDVPILVGIEVTGPPVPPKCVLTDADFFTCPDGTVIQLNECVNGVKVPIVPTPTCPPAPPAPPPPAVGRAMVMAIPNIVPEGRTVDIVVQALCAGVESDGEDATLLVDDVAVMTRPTAAGEVSFRWVATEIGTRMVCVSIPANPACPYPGAVCRSITVVTYLPEVKEQVELEMSEYETELYKLRKIRELERERLRGVAVPHGTVRIPPSLAGSTVVIGGIPRVVPPEGISVTVPAGESIVTIIKEGVRDVVPVLILPGETEKLPWGS